MVQIEQHLSSVREQLEGLLSAAGKEGSHVLQEIEQRVRTVGDARLQDLLALETWYAPTRPLQEALSPLVLVVVRAGIGNMVPSARLASVLTRKG